MSSIKPLFLKYAVDAVSYFDDNEPAIPAASKISTGTEGISTCIAVFIRTKTENNDCLMGSIHLKSGYDLKEKISILTSIADLYKEIKKLSREKFASGEIFAIGGEISDDTDEIEEQQLFCKTIEAVKGTFNLTLNVPAVKQGEFLDIYMDENTFVYQIASE